MLALQTCASSALRVVNVLTALRLETSRPGPLSNVTCVETSRPRIRVILRNVKLRITQTLKFALFVRLSRQLVDAGANRANIV